ncbi:hypothetical protein CCR97_19960 [Rhodoplanes elegans]|uniref:Uncharacterized protein n=1 Tax=Rhodoplanes elegans TaxID=29408 RepID=A0A327KI37_9BRAD|nr:hypothetical protein [Rhodoplanes elegans]MBK5960454.1 hypothetical protein [Rhodoplanes elegans]RAI37791.1 hypothetical protein CH338_14910 [Rhodoplanes elegans]
MAEQTRTVQDGEIIAPRAEGTVAEGTVLAHAQLPNLEIEVVHGTLPDGSGERLSINLTATPSFEAFGQALEGGNPFALWMQVVQSTWAPLLAMNPLVAADPLLSANPFFAANPFLSANPLLAANPFFGAGGFAALGGMPVCGFPGRQGAKGPGATS